MNIFQHSHNLKELLASSQNSGGINKPQSGCNEAGRVNDSSVSIVTKCVLAIGDLQRNRVGIMYPLPPPPSLVHPHNIQRCSNTLSTEWTPVNRSACLLDPFNK